MLHRRCPHCHCRNWIRCTRQPNCKLVDAGLCERHVSRADTNCTSLEGKRARSRSGKTAIRMPTSLWTQWETVWTCQYSFIHCCRPSGIVTRDDTKDGLPTAQSSGSHSTAKSNRSKRRPKASILRNASRSPGRGQQCHPAAVATVISDSPCERPDVAMCACIAQVIRNLCRKLLVVGAVHSQVS